MVTVSGSGMAGSALSTPVRICRSQQLQDGGVGLPAALAHGLQAVANSVVPHMMQHRRHDPRPRRAERMIKPAGSVVVDPTRLRAAVGRLVATVPVDARSSDGPPVAS